MLKELTKEIHDTAVEKGWWDAGDRNFGEVIALIHSELSEALEDYRNGYDINCIRHKSVGSSFSSGPLVVKPEGIPIELADVIIRILDFCGRHDIDISDAIRKKVDYNKTRPYKHGKKI